MRGSHHHHHHGSKAGGTVTPTPNTGWKTNKYGTLYKSESASFTPNTDIITRTTGPFRSMPQSGVLKAGQTIHYDEVMKQDGHVWVGYTGNSGQRIYLPVRTWNKSTNTLGVLWGTIKGRSSVASSEDVIKEFMRFKVRMEGSVNGHEFEIEGEGEGRPYEGTQTAKLKVTKGGPLPFAWDILSPQFQYGSKAYVKHPADIPDYLKLSFPEGFKWERVMNFEDGGVVTVTQDSSLQDGEFIYKVKLRGTNFPSDGPVMQKKTMGWEASTERMYPEDGALKGEIKMRLKLKDGGHYDAEVKTTYMAKKPVQLPGAYKTDIKLDITSHNEDYTIVEQYERAEGRHSTGA
nr:CWBD-mRFP1 fusion protein [synthetic construct]